MKKRYLVTGLMAALLATTLTGCDTEEPVPSESSSEIVPVVTLSSITATGGKASFKAGDTFDKGDLVVKAKYSDNTEKDVTAEAKVISSAVNMFKSGEYPVYVQFGGKVVSYNVVVNKRELKDIEVVTSDAKLKFDRGSTFAPEGLVVNLVYAKGANDVSDVKLPLQDLSTATYVVKNSKGEEVTGNLNELGTYHVDVKFETFATDYEIEVVPEKIENDTIENTIALASKYKNLVAEGSFNDASRTLQYAYGDNTLVTSQKKIMNGKIIDQKTYYTVDGEEGFAYIHNDNAPAENEFESVDEFDAKIVNGLPETTVHNNKKKTYGPEELLESLYAYAKSEDSVNYKEELVGEKDANGLHDKYKFSFYLNKKWVEDVQEEDNTTTHRTFCLLQVFEVEYSLSDTYFLDELNYKQSLYQLDESLFKEDGNYDLKALQAEAKKDPSVTKVGYIPMAASYNQDGGSRDAKATLTKEQLMVKGFTVKNGETEVASASNIKLELGEELELNVSGVTPETASLVIDQPTISENEYVYAEFDRFTNKLKLYGTTVTNTKELEDGTVVPDYAVLTVKTSGFTYTLNVEVVMPAPKFIDSGVWTEVFEGVNSYFTWNYVNDYYDINATEASLYLMPLFDFGVDDRYTAELVGAPEGATLTQYVVADQTEEPAEGTPEYSLYDDCYKFVATAAGTYTVKFTSVADENISDIVTIVLGDDYPMPTDTVPEDYQQSYGDEYQYITVNADNIDIVTPDLTTNLFLYSYADGIAEYATMDGQHATIDFNDGFKIILPTGYRDTLDVYVPTTPDEGGSGEGGSGESADPSTFPVEYLGNYVGDLGGTASFNIVDGVLVAENMYVTPDGEVTDTLTYVSYDAISETITFVNQDDQIAQFNILDESSIMLFGETYTKQA